ncbi:MAG TPA: VOC family protein [Nocardioides sp.]|nr:VOC family protein [Nocardioides sp.]
MTGLAELAELDVLEAAGAAFCAQQSERLAELGIDVASMPVSHLAIRTPTWTSYLQLRDGLEAHASANLENVWNGRPISKILLARPLRLGLRTVDLIELIPPFHQRVYPMGLEHVAFVVGDGLEEFVERYADVLTGRQFQTRSFRPAYRMFDDYTHVKFYAWSLYDACVREGATFEGFVHADWHPADADAGPYEIGCADA